MKIHDLKPDDKNFNLGTKEGVKIIRESLSKLGAGRSILIDKDNNIIAGNKTVEGAIAVGIEDVHVVETTGDKLVAVKRMDIDLDSKKGRELALADNVAADKNILISHEVLDPVAMKYDIDVSEWGIEAGFKPKTEPTAYSGEVAEDDVEKAKNKLETRFSVEAPQGRTVICHKCGHEFTIL